MEKRTNVSKLEQSVKKVRNSYRLKGYLSILYAALTKASAHSSAG
ncbi:hypothetical protein SPWS13_3256 [Shewanella putrefaciens]|nr:hypothetical protein SPWS13_3256 [Shewanella putrefaciens]